MNIFRFCFVKFLVIGVYFIFLVFLLIDLLCFLGIILVFCKKFGIFSSCLLNFFINLL